MTEKILIVDDEENICFTLKRFLSDEGYEVSTANEVETALEKIEKIDFDLVFADILLKGRSGIEILKAVKDRKRNCPVVMITGVPTVDTASEAVRLGAFDYLPKPVVQKGLLKVARAALGHKQLVDEKEAYRSNLEAIFSSVKDGLISVDKDLNIIEFNNAAQKICGALRRITQGNLLGPMKLFCNGPCVSALEQTIATKKLGEYSQIRCKYNNDTEQVVSLTVSPLLDPNGNLSGGILAIKDQTRLFHLEQDLKMRHKCHNIIGKSDVLQNIFSLIENLADVKTTVLISGESGTGKELVADALHFKGNDPKKPLVKLNCGALPENLLESELFGHVKGAFSGAIKDRVGRFEHADGGTIFLDEVGNMSPRMQLRLLRVLQEQEFERVGDSTTIKVNVRVVTATNLDLKQEISKGRFRQDLYYRLKVVEIKLPPLRHRREDIPLLMDHFIQLFNKQFDKQIKGVSNEVCQAFMKYSWLGNIRELRHAIEHAFIVCPLQMIDVKHLPAEISGTNDSSGEKEVLLRALEKTRWNKTKAAAKLGMSRQSLYRKIKAHNISDI